MRVRTGRDLRAARETLGWSTYDMARALLLKGAFDQEGRGRHHAGTRVLHMEQAEDQELGGPTQIAVEAFLDGWVPEHMRDQVRAVG